MPLLPRVIIGVISVQLVCFWRFLQPQQLDVKHDSLQVTADERADVPSLFFAQFVVCCKEFRRQKNVSHSMLGMHPIVVSNGETGTWSMKLQCHPVDGTFAQRCIVLLYNTICMPYIVI